MKEKIITKEGKKFIQVTETKEVPLEHYEQELQIIEDEMVHLEERKAEIQEQINKFN